jgi:plasmid stabilization system protein ParE
MAARVREVVWAESARDALDEVIEYIPGTHDQLRPFKCLKRLRELNDPAFRELLVFKYRLLYEVEDHRVLIVAFLHGARDFATWWRAQQQE